MLGHSNALEAGPVQPATTLRQGVCTPCQRTSTNERRGAMAAGQDFTRLHLVRLNWLACSTRDCKGACVCVCSHWLKQSDAWNIQHLSDPRSSNWQLNDTYKLPHTKSSNRKKTSKNPPTFHRCRGYCSWQWKSFASPEISSRTFLSGWRGEPFDITWSKWIP